MKLPGRVKKKYVLIPTLVVILSFLFIHIVQAVTTVPAEPGSDGDPLVTQGYVDSKDSGVAAKISELKVMVDSLKAQVDNAAGDKFEVLNIQAGKQLTAGAGSEIILRSGSAKSVMGQNGGMSDVTVGKDLGSGTLITPNHLLIASRNDGRGLKAVNELWLLVRGTYTVK